MLPNPALNLHCFLTNYRFPACCVPARVRTPSGCLSFRSSFTAISRPQRRQAPPAHLRNSAHGATFSPMQFPLALPLKYKAISPKGKAIAGTGSTVLLSSTDIVFSADQPLRRGMECELSIAWPVLLETRIRLQLVLQSVITRSEGQFFMGRVSKYEFRTQVRGRKIFE